MNRISSFSTEIEKLINMSFIAYLGSKLCDMEDIPGDIINFLTFTMT